MSSGADELVAAYLGELDREAARLPWNARAELLDDVRSHIEVARAETSAAGEAAGGRPGDAAAVVQDGDESGARSGEAAEAAEITRVRAILGALGEPGEIVAAALADEPPPPPPAAEPRVVYVESAARPSGPPYELGLAEVFAVTLLMFGGFLLAVGWAVGLALLWISPRWNTREKLIGTFFFPGGIGGGLLAVTQLHSTRYHACESSNVGTLCGWHTRGWEAPAWLSVLLFLLAVVVPVAVAAFLVNRAHQRPYLQTPMRGAVVVGVGATMASVFLAGGLLFAVSSTTTHSGTANYSPAPAPVSSSAVFENSTSH